MHSSTHASAMVCVIIWPWHLTFGSTNVKPKYMCTRFGVDSSSHFPFKVRTHIQTHTNSQTPLIAISPHQQLIPNPNALVAVLKHCTNKILQFFTGDSSYLYIAYKIVVAVTETTYVSIVISMSNVCLSAHISQKPHVQTSWNFCTFSCGLVVLWW